MNTTLTPLSLDQVADNLERLLLRYEELQRANPCCKSNCWK